MNQWLEALLLQRTRVQFLAPTWLLATTLNASSRGSDILFWFLHPSGIHMGYMHVYAHRTLIPIDLEHMNCIVKYTEHLFKSRLTVSYKKPGLCWLMGPCKGRACSDVGMILGFSKAVYLISLHWPLCDPILLFAPCLVPDPGGSDDAAHLHEQLPAVQWDQRESGPALCSLHRDPRSKRPVYQVSPDDCQGRREIH